ncbi:MAG: dihydrolipoyl dehydrogenase [Clostridia bacterium]|nr:dihydrolipoyl dehydrogenase [Clostridia bacterium]MBQ5769969.1 dihydrolipoyl dehydrogenase [Clostridia bacterium]
MELFDLIVIGGGPGGYLAAERAAQGGLKVCLFEKRALGGVCLNEGCIPTKTLLNSAKLYRHATESKNFGVTAENVVFDHAQVIKRKAKVVKTLVSGVGMTMDSHKVNVVKAPAEIQGKEEGKFKVVAEGKAYHADRLIIATGSEAVVPPIPGVKEGVESGFVTTNREILDMTELPKTLAVIGGGVIGLEMACYFASVGVKVTVIEMMKKIAGPTDNDICKVLMNEYAKRGMEFKLEAKVLEVKPGIVVYEDKDGKHELETEKVLLSVGRRASTRGIGLESIGVEMNRGAIVTDDKLMTNVPNVYAVGDCNGKVMLAHTAYREAEVAVNNILGKKDVVRYECIPSVIYTDPEVASVGDTKEACIAKGMNVKEVNVPMMYAGRYVAEVDGGKGFCKVVYDLDKKRVVGVHMVGSYASEMILSAAMMVDTELPADRLKKFVFPHPTVCEVIREAIFKL